MHKAGHANQAKVCAFIPRYFLSSFEYIYFSRVFKDSSSVTGGLHYFFTLDSTSTVGKYSNPLVVEEVSPNTKTSKIF